MKDYRGFLDADRRLCLLRSLACLPGRRANHIVLHEMLGGFGHEVSREALLADLARLEEMGLASLDCLRSGGNGCTVATLSPRGWDVALGHATLPGIRRPLPGDLPDPEAV